MATVINGNDEQKSTVFPTGLGKEFDNFIIALNVLETDGSR
jgi:hypothetical protein